MLVLSILILLIITLGYLLGHSLLKALKIHQTSAIYASWIGILLLSVISTALALIGGLNPINGSILVVFVLFVSKDTIKSEWTKIFSSNTIGILFVIFVSAWYINHQVFWYDSGLYHIQVIKWLSEHGYVWGLGLLHTRLGVISSWFALPAYFNHYALAGSMYALMGGVALSLAMLHLASAIANIYSNGGKLSDRFVVFAYLLACVEIFKWGMAISPTPDLPIIILSILIGSMFVDMFDSDDESHKKQIILSITLLAFLMVTIKLSAAIMAVAALSYVYKYHKLELKTRKILIFAVTLIAVVLPNIIASFKTTGSLWYPLPLTFDVNWGLSAETAKNEIQTINEWAKWEGGKPAGAPDLGYLLPKYRADALATGRIYQFLLSVWSVASIAIILSIATWKARYKHVPFVVLSAIMVLFFYKSAPTLRFGLGMLVWLPAFSLALWRQKKSNIANFQGYNWASFASSALVVVIFVRLIGHAPIEEGMIRQLTQKLETTENATMPSRLVNIQPGYKLVGQRPILAPMPLEVNRMQTNNLEYFVPKSEGMCWDYALPCTNGEQKNIALKNKEDGISGGFMIK